jgi:hypothetical protein
MSIACRIFVAAWAAGEANSTSNTTHSKLEASDSNNFWCKPAFHYLMVRLNQSIVELLLFILLDMLLSAGATLPSIVFV